ncbi:MAG: hypothetical protein U7127_08395 [Phormidium sp.]
MMTIQAWPFLISRNQSIDYKTVVAPDFIAQAKIRSLLGKVSEEYLSESEDISIREIQTSEVGKFTVVFRSVKARSNDIGKNRDEVLKDPFGREIYWLEGLVFQGSINQIYNKNGKSYKIDETSLEQAHISLQEKYRNFWNEDELSVSNQIELKAVSSDSKNFRVLKTLDLRQHPPLPARPNIDAKFVLIAIGVLLLLIVILNQVISGILSAQQLKSIENCVYVTRRIKIELTNGKEDGNKFFNEVKQNNPNAWIFLNGSLSLDEAYQYLKDLPEKNKNLMQRIKDKNKDNTNKNPTPAIKFTTKEEPKPTLEVDQNNQLKINMSYQPIDGANTVLKDKIITKADNLEAIIIEPTLSENGNQRCVAR